MKSKTATVKLSPLTSHYALNIQGTALMPFVKEALDSAMLAPMPSSGEFTTDLLTPDGKFLGTITITSNR